MEIFHYNDFGGRSSGSAVVERKCEWTTPLIVGGVETQNGEFPHMAAIGWISDDGLLSFKCGGSLISDRFVLTAAHCSQDKDEREAPSFVRLGDQNLKNRKDGMVEVDVPIAEFLKHEKYDPSLFYYDIALIRMNKSISFTDNIRPACLWQAFDIAKPNVIATGWGYTKFRGQTSDALMKVELNVIDNLECDNILDLDRLKNGVDSAQMCAGNLTGGHDICNGGKYEYLSMLSYFINRIIL